MKFDWCKVENNIEIRFNPLKRLSPFKEDLNLSVVGSKRKLLTTGSCQGIEVALESDAVPFGSIWKDAEFHKLQMENSGDLGTKFKWDNSSFGPDFLFRQQRASSPTFWCCLQLCSSYPCV